jgi:glycosyltransferase involved in cell wall biosynthesis
MKPRISIVMGVCNGEETLRDTIQSIIAQTISDWEFILVDDASTDSTPQILKSYEVQDSRLRVVRQPQNRGLTHALIAGCKEAQGEFIARQDNGDYAFPLRLAKQLAFLEENQEVVAVGCGMRRIGPKCEYLGDVSRDFAPQEVTRIFLETGKSIVHATAMIRKSAYDSVDGYRAQFRVAQDTDLWYQLCKQGLLAEMPDILNYIAIDLKGISALSSNKQRRLANIARQIYDNCSNSEVQRTLLKEAERISSEKTTIGEERKTNRSLGAPNYFIGSELYALRNAQCRQYLGQAILHRYRILRSITKYTNSYFNCSPQSPCNLAGIPSGTHGDERSIVSN